jgi:hypothetical protein
MGAQAAVEDVGDGMDDERGARDAGVFTGALGAMRAPHRLRVSGRHRSGATLAGARMAPHVVAPGDGCRPQAHPLSPVTCAPLWWV